MSLHDLALVLLAVLIAVLLKQVRRLRADVRAVHSTLLLLSHAPSSKPEPRRRWIDTIPPYEFGYWWGQGWWKLLSWVFVILALLSFPAFFLYVFFAPYFAGVPGSKYWHDPVWPWDILLILVSLVAVLFSNSIDETLDRLGETPIWVAGIVSSLLSFAVGSASIWALWFWWPIAWPGVLILVAIAIAFTGMGVWCVSECYRNLRGLPPMTWKTFIRSRQGGSHSD